MINNKIRFSECHGSSHISKMYCLLARAALKVMLNTSMEKYFNCLDGHVLIVRHRGGLCLAGVPGIIIIKKEDANVVLKALNNLSLSKVNNSHECHCGNKVVCVERYAPIKDRGIKSVHTKLYYISEFKSELDAMFFNLYCGLNLNGENNVTIGEFAGHSLRLALNLIEDELNYAIV